MSTQSIPGEAPPVPELAESLARRWKLARVAALKSAAGNNTTAGNEQDLLMSALQSEGEDAHRKVFDNSLALARGARSYYRLELSWTGLCQLLPALDTPCTNRVLGRAEDESALLMVSAGCPYAALGPRACDFWQEAVQGLVLGLMPGVNLSRHRSCGHGDERCVDAIHLSHSRLVYGEIPEEMKTGLKAIAHSVTLLDSTSAVTFVGLSQRVLYFRLTHSPETKLSFKSHVERRVRRLFPEIKAREVSSRAVLPIQP